LLSTRSRGRQLGRRGVGEDRLAVVDVELVPPAVAVVDVEVTVAVVVEDRLADRVVRVCRQVRCADVGENSLAVVQVDPVGQKVVVGHYEIQVPIGVEIGQRDPVGGVCGRRRQAARRAIHERALAIIQEQEVLAVITAIDEIRVAVSVDIPGAGPVQLRADGWQDVRTARLELALGAQVVDKQGREKESCCNEGWGWGLHLEIYSMRELQKGGSARARHVPWP
jgi:hypothetical protein